MIALGLFTANMCQLALPPGTIEIDTLRQYWPSCASIASVVTRESVGVAAVTIEAATDGAD